MQITVDAPVQRPAGSLHDHRPPLRTCCECGAAYEAVTADAAF